MNQEAPAGVVEEISIGSILEPSINLRTTSEGIVNLAGSIMREGLLEPIIVRPKNGKFELVAGSRRLAACRMLGWRKVPCQVVELSDQESFEVALAENIARRTLDPVEEAMAFQKYVGKYGWGSEAELAKKIGKSPSYVSKRLRLLALPSQTLQGLFRRRNNPSLAEELLAIQDEELKAHLISLSHELDLSSKEVRRLRMKAKHGRHGSSDDPFTSVVEEQNERRSTTRAIHRTVVALRVALHRLDEVIENVGDEQWILREILLQQRVTLHSQIDVVMNLTKRIEKLPRPLF